MNFTVRAKHMAKRQRKLRTRGDDRFLGLSKALGQLESFGGALVDKLAARAVAQLGKNISYKIIMYGTGTRICGFDEKAYEVYAALIDRYRKLTELYEQQVHSESAGLHLESVRSRDIIRGISSIISSRIKFAEENGDLSGENPVSAEKNRLITALLQEFYKECKLVPKEAFTLEIAKIKRHRAAGLAAAFSREAAEAAFTDIISRVEILSQPIYPIYRKKCQSVAATLNDLNIRKSASYYFRLIETEKDLLESIVKIQLNALELELTNNQEEQANRLPRAIRECYQIFMKDASQILDALHSASNLEDPPFTDSHENYQADLAHKLSAEQAFPVSVFEMALEDLPALLNNYERELRDFLRSLVEQKVSKASLDKTLYELRKNVTQSALMANEMINVFVKVHSYYKAHEDTLSLEPCVEIISGIDETTVIKIMNIKDGKSAFYDGALQKLAVFLAEGREICEAVFEGISQEISYGLLEALLANPPEGISRYIENAFDAAFSRGFALKTNKTEATWQNEISKMILAFKREVLLYEMGTFDEIMNFSVSKLVEDAGENHKLSLSYANHLKKAQNELIEILGRNGISRIQPMPHDPFDGREHDVLMAERTEGFAKGEIVKTFASGYREKETILVRASVIAAK